MLYVQPLLTQLVIVMMMLLFPQDDGFILPPGPRLTTTRRLVAQETPGPDFHLILDALKALGISSTRANSLHEKITACGFESTAEVLSMARGFSDRPEALTAILTSDLKLSIFDAHVLRSALLHMLDEQSVPQIPHSQNSSPSQSLQKTSDLPLQPSSVFTAMNRTEVSRKYRETRVVNRAVRPASSYGLRENDLSPSLKQILSDFASFMTEISPVSQEPPIRKPTAEVYMR